jgi:hypothetical protein
MAKKLRDTLRGVEFFLLGEDGEVHEEVIADVAAFVVERVPKNLIMLLNLVREVIVVGRLCHMSLATNGVVSYYIDPEPVKSKPTKAAAKAKKAPAKPKASKARPRKR